MLPDNFLNQDRNKRALTVIDGLSKKAETTKWGSLDYVIYYEKTLQLPDIKTSSSLFIYIECNMNT